MLTDTKLKALKPKEKRYRCADSSGLCIEVHPKGGLYWRYRYRFAGKQKMLSQGTYPAVSVKDARRRGSR